MNFKTEEQLKNYGMMNKGPKPGTKNALTILYNALGIKGTAVDAAVHALHRTSAIETGFKNIDSHSIKSNAAGYYQMMPATMKSNMVRFNRLIKEGLISKEDMSYFKGLEGTDVKGMSKDLQAVHSTLNWAYAKNVPFKDYLKNPNKETFQGLYEGHVGNAVKKDGKRVYESNEHITNMNNKLDLYKDEFTNENAYQFLDMEYAPETNSNNLQDIQTQDPIDRTEQDYLNAMGGVQSNEFTYGGATDITGSGSTFTDLNIQGDNMFSKINTEQEEFDPNMSFRGEQFQAPQPNVDDKLQSLIGNTVGIAADKGFDMLRDRNKTTPGSYANTFDLDIPSFDAFSTPVTMGASASTFGQATNGLSMGDTIGQSDFDFTSANNLVQPDSIQGGTDGSGFSVGAGTYAAAAGMLAEAFTENKTAPNNLNINRSADYDFSAQRDTGRTAEYNKGQRNEDTTYDYASIIPFVGAARSIQEFGTSMLTDSKGRDTVASNWWDNLSNPIGWGINNFQRDDVNDFGDFFNQFKPEEMTHEQKMADYMTFKRPEIEAQQKSLYNTAFSNLAETGGDFNSSNYLELTSPELRKDGMYEVVGDDTHNDNPQRGYTFSTTPEGVKNKVSRKEVVGIDGRVYAHTLTLEQIKYT